MNIHNFSFSELLSYTVPCSFAIFCGHVHLDPPTFSHSFGQQPEVMFCRVLCCNVAPT